MIILFFNMVIFGIKSVRCLQCTLNDDCKFFSWEPWETWTPPPRPNGQLRIRYMCCPSYVKPQTPVSCLRNCSISTAWKETRPCPTCTNGNSLFCINLITICKATVSLVCLFCVRSRCYKSAS